jgi:hypothetical protein
MTPAKLKALRWFEAQGQAVGLFPAEVSKATRKRLEEEGLIEKVPGRSMFQHFQISQAGRDAIAQSAKRSTPTCRNTSTNVRS